jgi:hypothetical protein
MSPTGCGAMYGAKMATSIQATIMRNDTAPTRLTRYPKRGSLVFCVLDRERNMVIEASDWR